LSGVTASSFYAAPIRAATQSTALGYDVTNKEITYYTPSSSATSIDVTDTESGVYFPTFVSATGSGQTLRADAITTPLQFTLGTNSKQMLTYTTSTTTNQVLKLLSLNSGITNQGSTIEMNSGSNTVSPTISLNAQNSDGSIYSNLAMSDTQFWGRYNYYDDGTGNNYSTGLRSYFVGVNQVTSTMYSDDGTGSGTTGVRVGNGTIDLFYGGAAFAASTANFASFSQGSTTIFYRPLGFNGNNGVLENSKLQTIGATPNPFLFNSTNLFLTTIVSTTATRTIVLPNTSGVSAGYWYGICNKSTFLLTIQYPSGTTIATIAGVTAGFAGNSARFAVDSSGNYFCPTQ